jgi:hypothetical protein
MYITCHEVNAFKDGYDHSFHVFIYKEEVKTSESETTPCNQQQRTAVVASEEFVCNLG